MCTELKTITVYVETLESRNVATQEFLDTLIPLEVEFYHTNTEEYPTAESYKPMQVIENQLVSLTLDGKGVDESELAETIGKEEAENAIEKAYEEALHGG